MGSSSYDSIQRIQLETSSRCNLQCKTCLKPVYQKDWFERDMDQALFLRILSQMKKIKPVVHLQGWGEPLMQKEFITFVEELKRENITASFTTNGTVMTKSLAESLVKSGVDGVTFSMAGACASTQDRLRGAGTFTLLQNSITTLVQARNKYQDGGLQIAVSYLLTTETINELPQAISWCRKVGVDAFVTVNLSQSGGAVQKKISFLPTKKESGRYRFLRMKINATALLGRMKINMKPFCPTLTPVCDKNPLNSLFINANGDVSPCVFLAPPVKKEILWELNDCKVSKKAFILGNVNDLTLQEIWESEKYQAFRSIFQERKEYHDKRLAKVSYSLSGSVELETAVRDINSYFASHRAPEQCLACAKLEGY